MPGLVDECMTARSGLCRSSSRLKTWWQLSSRHMYWTVRLAHFLAAGSLSRATQSCLRWMRHHQKLLSLCRACRNSRTWPLLRYLTSGPATCILDFSLCLHQQAKYPRPIAPQHCFSCGNIGHTVWTVTIASEQSRLMLPIR